MSGLSKVERLGSEKIGKLLRYQIMIVEIPTSELIFHVLGWRKRKSATHEQIIQIHVNKKKKAKRNFVEN